MNLEDSSKFAAYETDLTFVGVVGKFGIHEFQEQNKLSLMRGLVGIFDLYLSMAPCVPNHWSITHLTYN